MLREISKMEQRYDAVLMVIRDGFSVTEVAAKLKISRQSLYRWMVRYEEGGLQALEERSHRPHSSPNQIDAALEALIVELRLRHPSWGPVRLSYELARRDHTPPSHMAIYRALKRRGLVISTRKKLPHYKRWERGRAMELWQMDVVGGVLAVDGTEAKILTGIDDHSRFIVCCGVMARATLRPVCQHFAASLERYGAPDELLTDNGKVFTNRFGHTDAETLFDRLCRENGITHLLTAPRSPTTTGKIERFHRTLRQEFLTGRVFHSLDDAQAQLDGFIHLYNHDRPHQSLQMQVPAERFNAAKRVDPIPATARVLDEERSGDDWISRTVNVNGVVTVKGQAFSVGKNRSGAIVDVHVTDGVLEVWDGAELIKAVKRTSTGPIRKKRAESRERS